MNFSEMAWAAQNRYTGKIRWVGDQHVLSPEPTPVLESVLVKYSYADSHKVLDFVLDNWRILHNAGMFEAAFLDAWGAQKDGVPHWSIGFCRTFFATLDRVKLLCAGDPLPPGDSFTVYRGVAGIGSKRRVRGYSWTGDLGIAKNFASFRVNRYGLPKPAVYSAVIHREHVLAYLDACNREEKEFLLLPDKLSNIRRVYELGSAETTDAEQRI